MIFSLFIFILFFNSLESKAEFGHKNGSLDLNNEFKLTHSSYKDTEIAVSVSCVPDAQSIQIISKLALSNCIESFRSNAISTNNSDPITIDKTSEIYCNSTSYKAVSIRIPTDGIYLFGFKLQCLPNQNCSDDVKVFFTVDIKGDYGYLSAIEYPLRMFYILLGLAYTLLNLMWLAFIFWHWKHLLRIQYFITLMLFIGLFEQITFFGIYDSLNKAGFISIDTLLFAELIRCLKHTLARFLVMAICIGYGINKSRLGPVFRRMVILCAIYFVFLSIESYFRAIRDRFDYSIYGLISSIPIAALDMIVLWWSLSNLLSTLRESRTHRNIVKHRLYRTFSCFLLILGIVSVVCMMTSILLLHWKPCTTHWRYIWFDETFWQLLFFMMLFLIVILWRPTSTNRVYASSAFLDPDTQTPGEEMEELLMEAIFTGGPGDAVNESKPQDKVPNSLWECEDGALRWAEENIPSVKSNSNAKDRNLRITAKID